jgi:hypothetical protein
MSTDDQAAFVGKLVLERTQAKQQSALLLDQIKGTAILCGNISGNIGGKNPDLGVALSKIDEISKRGGLDQMRSWMVDYLTLQARIEEISSTLNKAGAE